MSEISVNSCGGISPSLIDFNQPCLDQVSLCYWWGKIWYSLLLVCVVSGPTLQEASFTHTHTHTHIHYIAVRWGWMSSCCWLPFLVSSSREAQLFLWGCCCSILVSAPVSAALKRLLWILERGSSFSNVFWHFFLTSLIYSHTELVIVGEVICANPELTHRAAEYSRRWYWKTAEAFSLWSIQLPCLICSVSAAGSECKCMI